MTETIGLLTLALACLPPLGSPGRRFSSRITPKNDVFSPSPTFRGNVGFGFHGNSVVTWRTLLRAEAGDGAPKSETLTNVRSVVYTPEDAV